MSAAPVAEGGRGAALLARLLPGSLLGRLSVVMVSGLLLAQLLGNLIWIAQVRSDAETEARLESRHLALSAARTARYFLSLPANYRAILIQQFREVGGTRFFANLNTAPLAIQEIAPQRLSASVVDAVSRTLREDLPRQGNFRVGFAWPAELAVSDRGARIADLPDGWVQHILLLKPRPAPILVIQVELEPGHWLLLAALMPNPYFLDGGNPLAPDRLLLQGLSLAAVLLLSIPVVRWTTRPLAALADAAEAFGRGEQGAALPETGSREFVRTARAFSAMGERIQRYLEERAQLFVSISHDLRTPIMRLKLRTELLDDVALRDEFHDDLDELDMLVKGALQCVKDSDIHENPTEVRLDVLLARMIRGADLAGHRVSYKESGLSVWAKPLALKRALGNLLDNALHYGKTAEISVYRTVTHIVIRIRDHGPGVPEEAFAKLFEPYVRLDHGRDQNAAGMGLGLGIAHAIVASHSGELKLSNHPGGGLVAAISLPVPGAQAVVRPAVAASV